MREGLQSIAGFVEARPLLAVLVGGALLLAAAALAFVVVRRVLVRLVARVIRASRLPWDDPLLEHRVLHRAAWLAPLLVLYLGLPAVPRLPPSAAALVQRVVLAAFALVGVLTLNALLSAFGDAYGTLQVARDRPIKGYLQIVEIFLAVLGGVLIVAFLLDRSPAVLLTGIGALTAVLLLIFRDTILSFVASLQLASNDMVRLGDWIEMPRYGADGDVVDIALHTVKVQNARRLTNLGTFRAYVTAYLKQHPKVHASGLTFLVRQLAPGPAGLPLEIYVFSRDQTWAGYEGVQADVFDHLLAILPDFGLRVFQQPTGHDLAAWRTAVAAEAGGDGRAGRRDRPRLADGGAPPLPAG